MNVLYKRILRIVNWDMGTFPLLEVWKMKKGKFASCCRPLMGIVTVGALALGVSALAAPRPVDDSAVRGTNKGKTEVTRLVTGDPAQINAVIAGSPPSAILAVVPVNPPPSKPAYPAGVSIVGNELRIDRIANNDAFRAWFNVQVSNWDPNLNGDPALATYQVKIDCSGYLGSDCGAAQPDLAPAVVACPAPGGVGTCRTTFGEYDARCTGGFCDAGYVSPNGVNRPDSWCGLPEGCNLVAVNITTCNFNYLAVSDSVTGTVDGGAVYHGGTLVLDLPAGAKGKYTVNLNQDETFIATPGAPPVIIADSAETGFVVNFVTGSCCYGLGTDDAGCADSTTAGGGVCITRSDCAAMPQPSVFAVGGTCQNPPTADGCAACIENGRDIGTQCDDNDKCTHNDCAFPPGLCTNPLIEGFDDDTECCDTITAALTTINDLDVCTCDSCSEPNSRGHALNPPCAGDCNDGNPCTTPDLCDGQRSQADGGCVGTDVNSITCPAHVCPNDPLGVPYPCVDGFCFCTLIPKATFVLTPSSAKSPMCEGGANNGLSCKDNGDCPGGTCNQFADPLGANCFDEGEKITALVHFGSSGGPINGGQLLMTYDPSCVDYISATCMAPWTRTVYGPIVNEVAGTIFIVCGVDPFLGVNGPLGNDDMVSLSFNKVGECNECELCFANNNPQNSYLVDDAGQRMDIEPQCKSLQDMGDLVLDVPDNIKTNADCDGPTALETWAPPTATFSCPEGADLICRGAHESGMNMDAWVMGGGVFPRGFSSFCCYAWALGECDQHAGCLGPANDCAPGQGKPDGCWTVEVTDEVSLDIVVQLEPPIVTANHDGTLTRCIKFCLFADAVQEPICYDEDVTFGGMYNFIGKSRGKIKVAGTENWGCITAQDQMHTLRSCYLFQAGDCDEGQLHAQFSGDPAFGGYGSWLIGGNLDGWKKVDDNGVVTNPNGASLDVIDILDYGTFVSQFGTPCVDPPDTPCGTAGPNADINGDGCVTMADYNFIIRNFMVSAKDCCGGPQAASLPPALAEVSVDELRQMGLGELVVADLNGDGLVNAQDMDAFMQGARPTKTSNDRNGGKGLRSGR